MLDNVIIPFYINRDQPYLGCDDPNRNSLQEVYSYDLRDYHDYPFNIQYKFNSRGFRDKEWPIDINDKIWCVGDSATCGTGISHEHIYSNLLKDAINCGRYYADNEWIRDIASSILSEANPKLVVIQWSYFHRFKRYLLETEKNLLGNYGETPPQKRPTPPWSACNAPTTHRAHRA